VTFGKGKLAISIDLGEAADIGIPIKRKWGFAIREAPFSACMRFRADSPAYLPIALLDPRSAHFVVVVVVVMAIVVPVVIVVVVLLLLLLLLLLAAVIAATATAATATASGGSAKSGRRRTATATAATTTAGEKVLGRGTGRRRTEREGRCPGGDEAGNGDRSAFPCFHGAFLLESMTF
jgi:hypothetical protein